MPYGLEQCSKCGGERLVVREAPAAPMIISETTNVNAEIIMPPEPDHQEEQGMSVVKFKNEAEAEKYLGAGKVPADAAPRCPKHPGAPVSEDYLPTAAAAQALPVDIPESRPGPLPEFPCKNHLDRPARFDSMGRNMRFCSECLSKRGQDSGTENARSGKTSAPVAIPLNQMKYSDLKEWLVAQAEENERTLSAEIMYRLKLAMREASAYTKT
jgi:hypothetical protein